MRILSQFGYQGTMDTSVQSTLFFYSDLQEVYKPYADHVECALPLSGGIGQ